MHPLAAHMTSAPTSSSPAERLLAPRTSVRWMMRQEATNCKSVLDLSAKSRRYRITTAPGLFILIAEPYCPMRSSRLAWLTPTAGIVFHLKSFHSYVSAADRAPYTDETRFRNCIACDPCRAVGLRRNGSIGAIFP